MSPFSFFVVYQVRGLMIHLSSDETLSSRHPLKEADHGESAPYWPGAAQFEADGSLPVGYDDPSRRRGQHVASNYTPIECGLINLY